MTFRNSLLSCVPKNFPRNDGQTNPTRTKEIRTSQGDLKDPVNPLWSSPSRLSNRSLLIVTFPHILGPSGQSCNIVYIESVISIVQCLTCSSWARNQPRCSVVPYLSFHLGKEPGCSLCVVELVSYFSRIRFSMSLSGWQQDLWNVVFHKESSDFFRVQVQDSGSVIRSKPRSWSPYPRNFRFLPVKVSSAVVISENVGAE